MHLSFKDVYTQCKPPINSSTAQWQRDQFIQFFPCENEGRYRKYGIESIEILSLINSMFTTNKNHDEILDVLESTYGVQITDVVKQETNTTTSPQSSIEAIRLMFQEEMEKRDSAILELKETVLRMEQKSDILISEAKARDDKIAVLISDAKTRDEKADTRDENAIDRDKKLTESIRILQELRQQQANRKWWKIFF